MSEWAHTVCDACWATKDEFGKDGVSPVRMKNPTSGKCCFCGETTDSGIYVRYKSEALKCGGKHD